MSVNTCVLVVRPEHNISSNRNGSVLANNCFDNNLYRVYPDTLYTIYTIDFGNKSYPEEFFKSDDFMTVYEIFSKKTYANIEYAFENDDYLLLFIAEDHMEVSSSKVYFLYNKKLGTGEYQLFSSSSILLNAIGKPIDLTPNNEIVFLINSDLLGELKESYPLFDSINDNEGYVVAYLQIK